MRELPHSKAHHISTLTDPSDCSALDLGQLLDLSDRAAAFEGGEQIRTPGKPELFGLGSEIDGTVIDEKMIAGKLQIFQWLAKVAVIHTRGAGECNAT